MKRLTCIAACLFSVTCFAQTKLISFRSHSGSDVHFHTAVERNLFDIGYSNFGVVGEYKSKIDTVMKKSATEIIVLRKSYHVFNGKTDYTTFARDTLTKTNGADFFDAKNMDDMKAAIHKTYKTAIVDSTTRFIGFNKKFRW